MNWTIGEIYTDLKKEQNCILVKVEPYKRKAEFHLTFRYILDDTYVRKNEFDVIHRFKPTGQVVFTQPKVANEPVKSIENVVKEIAGPNVIQVDFKNRIRVA